MGSILLAMTVALGLASSASALTVYTDVVTAYWTFSGIQESSSYGDPEPLFGQPIGAGNDLVFFPPNFLAESTGGGIDATGSQLQLMITSSGPSHVIDTLNLTEFGDIVFGGFGGTGSSGVSASLAGFVTVLEANGVPIAPVVIGFTGTYAPVGLNTPGVSWSPGTQLWSASISVDIASQVANATKVMLSLDNDLFAASEATTSSKIQKKVVDGPAIILSIPEPGLLVLLVLSASALALPFRRS